LLASSVLAYPCTFSGRRLVVRPSHYRKLTLHLHRCYKQLNEEERMEQRLVTPPRGHGRGEFDP
jgi:hypothetical protein